MNHSIFTFAVQKSKTFCARSITAFTIVSSSIISLSSDFFFYLFFKRFAALFYRGKQEQGFTF